MVTLTRTCQEQKHRGTMTATRARARGGSVVSGSGGNCGGKGKAQALPLYAWEASPGRSLGRARTFCPVKVMLSGVRGTHAARTTVASNSPVRGSTLLSMNVAPSAHAVVFAAASGTSSGRARLPSQKAGQPRHQQMAHAPGMASVPSPRGAYPGMYQGEPDAGVSPSASSPPSRNPLVVLSKGLNASDNARGGGGGAMTILLRS